MGIAANAAHVRADKFKEAGYDGLPATWEEFIEAGKKITKPPFYAYGMALGLTPSDSLGDSCRSSGPMAAALVDAQSRPAFESDGTVEGFRLINDMYNNDKIIPRGALSWDNSGNNKAYQSGQVAYALNPTSIYSSLINDKSPFLDVTILYVRRAARPAGSSRPRPTITACSRSRRIRNWPKGWSQHFMKPENYSRFIVEAGGRYLPIYPAQLEDPFWTSKPAFAGLLEAAPDGAVDLCARQADSGAERDRQPQHDRRGSAEHAGQGQGPGEGGGRCAEGHGRGVQAPRRADLIIRRPQVAGSSKTKAPGNGGLLD